MIVCFFVSRFVMMVFKSLLSMFVDQKYPICSHAFVPTVLNGLNKHVLFLFEHVAPRCWMLLVNHMSLSQDVF